VIGHDPGVERECLRRGFAVLLPLLGALVLTATAAAAPRGTSDNWAGYAAYDAHFSSVRGSWTQPPANCFDRRTSYTQASFWVGLGGNDASSNAVEQIGTDSDCDTDGAPDYYAWYELWPADTVVLRLDVEPGDRLSASVAVKGSFVLLRLLDHSTGELFSRRVRMRRPDTSSAEWIVEAPTASVRRSDQVVPLTDFGTIRFSAASATSRLGHIGSIKDRDWQEQAIDFQSDVGPRNDPIERFVDSAGGAHGFPTGLSRGGRGFSVTWVEGERPAAKSPVALGAA
jgi:Peptidase A4 family